MPERLLDLAIQRVPVPDALMRPVVRSAVASRIIREHHASRRRGADPIVEFAAERSRGPAAILTQDANDQHYEVPAAFFELVLGPRLKYSSCLFRSESTTLAEAEDAMLALTVERAQIEDGMRVLDLGCGWGSLSLWLAERHPGVEVVAVSNSSTQRLHIEREAAARGLAVEVITADASNLALGQRFDRVVSIEMFEHFRNHRWMLDRVAEHLTPDGALLVHVFAHRSVGYEFQESWMSRRFFSGGVMPVHGWLGALPDAALEEQGLWWINGTHYARTSRGWLDNLDARRADVLSVLAARYGAAASVAHLRDWRLFFLACEEIFGFRHGTQYGISQSLLRPTRPRASDRASGV